MIPAEDLKGYTDLLVSLVGTGGVGAAVLAFLGYLKSRAERPASLPPDSPTVGTPAMHAIGAGIALEHSMTELSQHVRTLKHVSEDHEDHGRNLKRYLERLEDLLDKHEGRAA